MRKQLPKGKHLFFLFLTGIALWTSCKKENHPNPRTSGQDTTSTGPVALSDEDSLKFYVWYINLSDSANNVPFYLWNDQVPAINPFSPVYENADSLLMGSNGIASYPVVNGKKVDRYSFLDRTGEVTGEIQEGQAGDFGFDFNWVLNQDNSTSIYILYAYPGSPAALAGMERGYEITAIGGVSDLSYDGPGYGNGSDYNVNAVLKAFSAASTQFTFKKPDGTTITKTLDRATYHLNPILFDSVYERSGKKIGYFVYNSFVSVVDDSGNYTTPAKTELDTVFHKFQNAGINDLVVDLRYNGGGSVASAEYIDNWLAPASANNQLMYKYMYNSELTAYAQVYPDYLPGSYNFSKQGALALDHVIFIVGGGTASASELTMNNLKPYIDVKMIGDTTYGKPVGFFGFPIAVSDSQGNQKLLAVMYAINFHTVNSQNEGDYYDGFAPDKFEYDYIGYNWGDQDDPRLQEAFDYIVNGSFARSSNQLARMAGLPHGVAAMNRAQAARNFKGTVNAQLGRSLFKKIQSQLHKK